MEPVRVVARYADGRLLKGFTQNFSPERSQFHLTPVDSTGNGTVVIHTKDLKAVFFVRDFTGNPKYEEQREFAQSPQGRKVEVTFKDGEVLVGSALGYNRERPGFFFFPADPESNTLRVFVVTSAVKAVKFI
jgi:hypothetical protein